MEAVLKGPDDMPYGMYAANMGLALKKTASQYHDINLNLLQVVALPSQRRFKRSYAVVAGVVVVLAFLVFQTYSLKSGADARVTSLQQQDAAISQQIESAQAASKDAIANQNTANDKYQGVVSDLTAYRADNSVITGKKIDFANYLGRVIGVLPQNSELQSIDMQPGNITVKGIVMDSYDVLAYTSLLEGGGDMFPSATVKQLEPANDPEAGNTDENGNIINDRVSFQVSITY